MDADEANSWLRRTKFSHSVCRRLESAASLPLSISPERIAGLKSRRGGIDFSNKNSLPANLKILENPIFPAAKQRSASPLPETILPETFKEARSEKKRFSTPYSRKIGWDKGIKGKFIKHNSKTFSNAKSKNDSLPWTKYFDNGGGKVTAVDAVDEYMVDLSKLFLGLRFAHGAHSRLYHGVYRDEPVAVKIIRIPDDYENEDLGVRLEKQFSREVTLLSRLHHHNVIRFVAACRDAPVFCIITEYLSEGSLRGYLHKLEHKPLPLEKLIAISLDIARGMKYIHSQGVIHRDLKPENILIQEGFCMKIADFGIACEEANCDALSDDPGTYRWMAPEMIKDKSYGRKVDVYSFGLILWEMVAGAIPYEDMTPIQAAFAVVDKNTRPVIPADCPPAVRVLIEQCWLLQPEKRPEFWQVVKLLENFESLLANEGTLNQLTCEDLKGILQWIQKPRPVKITTTGSFAQVPKFL